MKSHNPVYICDKDTAPIGQESHSLAMAEPTADPTGLAVPAQPMPIDYSSIRSKSALVSPNEKQFELLRKRLQGRIDDSRGETIFDIGIGDGESE